MAQLYLILALIIQSSLTFANIDEKEDELTSRKILEVRPDADDDFPKDFKNENLDWMDMFTMPGGKIHPSSSVAMMEDMTSSNKTAEEQLKDIKELANEITLAIQSEMAYLLAFAMDNCEKDVEGNNIRKRRSVESPMDSTKLVMRLLKHIKSNNEYQNIAIEKMMTAQEIADKFGIEFTPDTEILSDLAFAANEQTKELSSILEEACTNNATNLTNEQVSFVPLEQNCQSPVENADENSTYYVYSVHPQHNHHHENVAHSYPSYEYAPEPIYNVQPSVNHVHYPEYPHNHYHPYETQMLPPPVYPTTPRPTFYDSMLITDPFPFCPMEPMTTTTTIILPIEEILEPEPELVGEEYEETVSSKVYVNHDEEPGLSTVNHVMTYTLSEKAHFKTPEIEKLPEQMQYTFFLM